MSKLYIFAIGGTGSRVLRSLTMMLASGVKLGADKIVPIIIDPDNSNADLTRTVDLMNRYTQIRQNLKFEEGAQSRFFKTDIQNILKNYSLPFQNIGGASFESYIGLSNMSREDQAFTRMLFSEHNLKSEMDVGFKGNPNIGSVVLNQIFESDEFKSIAKSFGQDDKIFIISSIFGGTGAAGFPMLLKTLRQTTDIDNAAIINKSNIGAITVLPYFKIASDPNNKNEIVSSTFISKTKSALAYYEKNISDNNQIDALYFLADTPTKLYKYAVGGSDQSNDAHLIEFMAASAIVHFSRLPYRKPDDKIQTENFELGLKELSGAVNFTNFYDELYSYFYYPLTQFALMTNALKDDFDYLKDTLPPTRPFNSELYISSFMKYLRNFGSDYQRWLTEMEGNERPLKLFNLNCGKKPFDIINGISEKSKLFELNKNYNRIHATLAKQGELSKKIVKDSKPSFFMEMFARATELLIRDKFNN